MAGARGVAGSTISSFEGDVARACQYTRATSPPSLIRFRLDQGSPRTPIDGSRRAAGLGRSIQKILRPQRVTIQFETGVSLGSRGLAGGVRAVRCRNRRPFESSPGQRRRSRPSMPLGF